MAIQDKNKTLKQKFLVLKDANNNEVKRIISVADLQVGLKDPGFPGRGLILPSHDPPPSVSNKLYNVTGSLIWDGKPVQVGPDVSAFTGIYYTPQTVTADITIPDDYNAVLFGPSVALAGTISVGTNSILTILS